MVDAKTLALELGRNSKEIIEKAKELGVKLNNKNNISFDEAAAVAEYISSGVIPQAYRKEEKAPKQEVEEEAPQKPVIDVSIDLAKAKKDTPRKPKEKKVVVHNETDEGKKKVTIKKTIFKEEKESIKKKDDKKEKKKVKKEIPKARKDQHVISFDRSVSFDTSDDNLEDEVFIMDTLSDEVHREQQKAKEEADALARSLQQNNNKKKFTKGNTQNRGGGGKKKKKYKLEKKAIAEEKAIIKDVKVPNDIRVYEFADKLNKNVGEIISTLFGMGLMITKNDFLDADTLEILAAEFEINIEVTEANEDFDYVSVYDEENPSDKFSEKRPPVVTIMGHVDHGKTSLLDRIRDSKVADGEAGGITQHIGAYMIEKNGERIAFLDTPGHEAFTEMRARGASVTDIAIIVVAGDDGVRPQTLEALSHTKAANVPILIAITKMDKSDINLDKVKGELAEAGYTPTDWGGEYDMIQVSSKTGKGIDELLEHIIVQSEVLELKADPKARAKGIIVESSVEIGRGTVATVVMQNGTLNVGDSAVVDVASGIIRTLVDDEGNRKKSIGPSEMAVITGLDKAPAPGSVLISVENDSIARRYAESISTYKREKELSKSTKVTFDELSSLVAEGKLKTLPIILKADAQGSLEAIKSSLEKLTQDSDELRINIIHSGVGGITESDLALVDASENGIILGFNIRPVSNVKSRAKQMGIEIKTYTIIYNLIDDVKALLGGMLSPVVEEENTGQAEVRETFKVGKVGVVAGCIVSDGIVQNGIAIRVIRDGAIIYQGTIDSLKRFKDDVKEVKNGYECGIMIKDYNDIKVGDFLETFKEVEKARDF